MGSGPPQQLDGDEPQQPLPAPVATRSAAWPYFSLTTSLMSISLISILRAIYRDDGFGLYRPVASAEGGVRRFIYWIHSMARSLSEALAGITLPDVDGREVRLGSLWERQPAVVVFLRHYG